MAVSSGGDIKLKVLIDYDTQGAVPLRDVDDGIRGIHKSSSGLSGVLDGMKGLVAEVLPAMTIAAAGAAFLSVVDSATKVDKGVREIGTLMGGLTDGEIKRMKEELSALSITSGQAMEPLVKARYDIVSSGFADAADSALILETSAKLAVAGVTEVSTAADVLTTVLSAYGMKAEEVGGVSDDLFTIVKLGKTTMTDLGSQFGVLAAVAAPAGVSVHEAGAALAALTVQGQSTSVSVTGISAAIMEMQKPSKEMQAALRSVGVESDNLIKTGGGLKGALDLVSQASEASGISVNKLFMREEALRAVLPLTGTAARTFADDLKEMEDNAGATDTAFNQMAQSSDFLQQQAWRAFDAVKNQIGDAIINSDLFKSALIGIRDGIISVGAVSGVLDQPISKMSDMDRALRTCWLVVESIGRSFLALGTIISDVATSAAKDNYNLAVALGLLNNIVLKYEEYMLTADKARLADEKRRSLAASQTGKDFSLYEMTGGGFTMIKRFQDQTAEITKQAEALAKNKIAHQGNTGAALAGASAADKHAKSSENSTIKAAAWDKALQESYDALSGTRKETLTLAEANDLVAVAFNAVIAAQLLGTDHARELTSATKDYNDAVVYAEKLQRNVKNAIEDANKALMQGKENTLSVAEATKLHDEAVAALTAEIIINRNAETASAESLQRLKDKSEDITETYKGQQKAIKSVADAYEEQTSRIADAISSIGTAYEAMTGSSIKGLDTLTSAIKKFSATNANGSALANRDLSGVLGIANGVGQMIGGGVGSAVSSGASGALGGLGVATALGASGPVGAVVGGVIGLVSSLFGGSQAGPTQGQNDALSAAQTNAQAIFSLANSGSSVARDIVARSGYSVTNLSGDNYTGGTSTPASAFYGIGIDKYAKAAIQGLSIFYTKETGYNTALVEELTAVESLTAAIRNISQTSAVKTLEDIQYKYEVLAVKSGDLAALEQARIADLIVAVTGITANNVAATVAAVFSDYAGYATAGDAFAARMTDAIKLSVQSMAINSLVNDAIMPMLQPVLAGITTRLMAGSLTGADMSSLITQIGTATEAISPLVTSLYNAIHDAGILTSDQSGSLTATVSDLSTTTTDLSTTVDTMDSSATALTDGVKDLQATNLALADSAASMATAVQGVSQELSSLAVTSTGNIVSAMDTTVSTIASMSAVNSSTESQQARIIALLETMLTVDGDNKVLLGKVSSLLDRVSQGGASIRTLAVTE